MWNRIKQRFVIPRYENVTKTETIEFDLVNQCNSKCPLCIRTEKEPSNDYLILEQFVDILNTFNPKNIVFMGAYSEPVLNKDFLGMVKECVKRDVVLNIHTNGGVKSPSWWKELNQIIQGSKTTIFFALDGLYQEQHEMYRKTNLNKVLENAKQIDKKHKIAQYIMFAHNSYPRLSTSKKNLDNLSTEEINKYISKFNSDVMLMNTADIKKLITIHPIFDGFEYFKFLLSSEVPRNITNEFHIKNPKTQKNLVSSMNRPKCTSSLDGNCVNLEPTIHRQFTEEKDGFKRIYCNEKAQLRICKGGIEKGTFEPTIKDCYAECVMGSYVQDVVLRKEEGKILEFKSYLFNDVEPIVLD